MMETTSTTGSKIRFSRFMELLLFLNSQKFSDPLGHSVEHSNSVADISKYPPAKPEALRCEPLKAA
jgi:hypothetical protein